jgi:hypothetical protein
MVVILRGQFFSIGWTLSISYLHRSLHRRQIKAGRHGAMCMIPRITRGVRITSNDIFKTIFVVVYLTLGCLSDLKSPLTNMFDLKKKNYQKKHLQK